MAISEHFYSAGNLWGKYDWPEPGPDDWANEDEWIARGETTGPTEDVQRLHNVSIEHDVMPFLVACQDAGLGPETTDQLVNAYMGHLLQHAHMGFRG